MNTSDIETFVIEDDDPPIKKKRRAGLSYCSVEGCASKSSMGMSFFRLPRKEDKCNLWKTALGFVGDHKYARLTPDLCHKKLRVCSLHFESNCFSSPSRIHTCAVPSLLLNNFECDDEFVEDQSGSNQSVMIQDVESGHSFESAYSERLESVELFKPAILESETCTTQQFPTRFVYSACEPPPLAVISNVSTVRSTADDTQFKTESDDSIDSTNFEPLPPNETFLKDQSTQTSIDLTPILVIKSNDVRGVDQNLNLTNGVAKETTLDDVLNFFDRNYSSEACKLLKAQIDVLEKSKRNTVLPLNVKIQDIRIIKVQQNNV